MSSVFSVRSLSLACLLAFSLIEASGAESLLGIGQPVSDAAFLGADETGALKFHVESQDLLLTGEQLIRWSTYRPNTRKAELVLHDGTRLVLADSWTGELSWQFVGSTVTGSTELFGKVSFPRSDVRAVLINAPKGLLPRTRFMDRSIKGSRRSDTLYLTNGDRWDGEAVSVVQGEKGRQVVQLFRSATEEPLEFPMQEIAAIVLKSPEISPVSRSRFVLGTRDGSSLEVEAFTADANDLQLRLACGVVLAGTDRRDVNYLFSRAAKTDYLSNRDAIDYRNVPYLTIPWQFQRDRNVLGEPLRSQGRVVAKGLGVHTASRLSFDLTAAETEKKFERFVASIAVDDAAGRRGSVIFRVYLRSDDKWQLAFESPVVRGGESALPVEVALGEATHLALLTDYADRGDELDYANWLEARLE